MADRRIEGKVIFSDTKAGIKGLQVAAFDLDPFFAEEKLGDPAETDAAGAFSIKYSLSRYHEWTPDRNPDIVVRVHAPGGRLLHATSEHGGVSADPLIVATIELHPANLKGWLVTNATLNPAAPRLRSDDEPETWTTGNKIELLKDGEALFPALTDDIENAVKSIHFVNMNFWISANLITKFPSPTDPANPFDPMNPKPGVPVKGKTVHEILKAKAKSGAIQPLQVLVQDIPFVDQIPVISFLLKRFFGVNPDTADEVKNFFADSPVQVRLLSVLTSFNLPTFMHAKAVVIDSSTAIILGSPMSQSSFGGAEHHIHDARHGGSLVHDVSIKVQGPAVEHVDRAFTTLWNAAEPSSPALSPSTGQAPVAGGVGVQIVRTLPGGVFTSANTGGAGLPHGETGALEAYQRAIANATRLIYLEDQYFTAPEIFASLLDRMKEVPALELILLMNSKPDVSGYPEKQIQNLRQFIADLAKALGGQAQVDKRVGVFTLWSCDEKAAKYEVMPVYIHSKSAVVDDVWATVGSTNLDGASLNQIELDTIFQRMVADLAATGSVFKRILGSLILMMTWPLVILTIALVKMRFSRKTQHANPQQGTQPTRSTELNLVVCEKAPAAGTPNPEVVRIREALWKEILGLPALPVPTPAKGWVQIWSERAEEKRNNLLADSAKAVAARQKHPAKILKWVPKIRAEDCLRELKLDLKRIEIREKADSFDFQSGRYRKK